MKISEALTTLKNSLHLFKKSPSEEPMDKKKKILIAVGIVVGVLLVALAVFLIVKKIKKRRLEREAAEAEEAYYTTDPDADEYAEEE